MSDIPVSCLLLSAIGWALFENGPFYYMKIILKYENLQDFTGLFFSFWSRTWQIKATVHKRAWGRYKNMLCFWNSEKHLFPTYLPLCSSCLRSVLEYKIKIFCTLLKFFWEMIGIQNILSLFYICCLVTLRFPRLRLLHHC